MIPSNSDLASAFPKAIRSDALVALLEFPEIVGKEKFPVRVGGELISIPSRIYFAMGRPTQFRLRPCKGNW
jgi:hypothetical protein